MVVANILAALKFSWEKSGERSSEGNKMIAK